MAIIFWSDPHLGLSRTSHTTPLSRKALKDALYQQAHKIVSSTDTDHYLCLGDLFDTEDNTEITIAQGAKIAERCSLVLSGNHDLPNRDGVLSSLQLIGELSEKSVIALDDSTPSFFCQSYPEAYVVAVPHKRTQQLFEETLAEVVLQPEKPKDRKRVVILHCNYDIRFESDDATLNLSRSNAQKILETFDYILIGHEHLPRSDFDGRLQVLGNIHPTSFSDISDKFIWRLSEEGLEPIQVWSSETGFLSVDWETLLSGIPEDSAYTKAQFVDVTGTCPAELMPQVARSVQKLWQDLPNALMIRNAVKTEALRIETPDVSKALDIPSRISADLAGSELESLWKEYLEALC